MLSFAFLLVVSAGWKVLHWAWAFTYFSHLGVILHNVKRWHVPVHTHAYPMHLLCGQVLVTFMTCPLHADGLTYVAPRKLADAVQLLPQI
mmetsp:Transcript_40461/g.71056  ORF Transcript_40461/g.71056 Transcript_40461/m.71056 type:complete len:90 (+) Transcript_40461:67-336(+)